MSSFDPLLGLDPCRASYSREVAERLTHIGWSADTVELALERVPLIHRAMVETLVVSMFADRIVHSHPVNKLALIAEVPERLRDRVITHIGRLRRLMKRGRA